MIEIAQKIDRDLFILINQTWANPFFDLVMPPLTDWNKHWAGLSLAGFLWILLFWKGGRRGRVLALLLIPLITMTDQMTSAIVKPFFHRPRPCHENGTFIEQLRLLVPCGSGYSFPSSHAVNNFALATFLGYYYRRWAWAYLLYASLMGFSRIVVGVHYPLDVAAGAFFGIACALLLIGAWVKVSAQFPILRIDDATIP